MNEQDENRLDDFLRNKLSEYRPQPRQDVWAAIEKRVNKPVPQTRRRFGRWMPVLLSGMVGMLVGWLAEPQFQHNQSAFHDPAPAAQTSVKDGVTPAAPAENPVTTAAQSAVSPIAAVETPTATPVTAPATQQTMATPVRASGVATAPAIPAIASTPLPAADPAGTLAPSTPSPTLPVSAAPVVAVVFTNPPSQLPSPVLEGLVTAEQHLQTSLLDTATSATTRQIMALQLEKAELAKLQRRVDSLMRVLAPEAALAASEADEQPTPVVKNRWSVVAAFAPERTFMGLQGPVGDTMTVLRRNHEEGRGSFNASLMGEYRVNNRLSLGFGLGYSSYGAQLRVTNRNTHFDVINDTSRTLTTDIYTSTHVITATFKDTVRSYLLDPHYNGTGQVLWYDTVWTYQIKTRVDTTRLVTTDVVQHEKVTITPLLVKRETTAYKVLRPDYRFVTIPLAVRYRLTPEVRGTRWWTDVAVGAQLQFFQGGTQLVTADGRNYYTQRIKRSDAPFRPLNVALTGQLAFNYALTSRLAVSVAPAVRWQMQSVYKKETGLKQQPTTAGLQLGARWTF